MLATEDLAAVNAAIETMLTTGRREGLELIGAGEISCVVGWQGFACKRLPPFDSAARVEAYGALLARYLEALRGCGVEVVDTAFQSLERDGKWIAYIVQPRVPADWWLPARMRAASEAGAVALVRPILDHVQACEAAGVGIDAQVTNWSVRDGVPLYLDVTTPMLRDEAGRDLLDTEIFVATLPLVVRAIVRRFLVGDLLNRFFNRRETFLDLVSNIANAGLAHLTEPLLAEVNTRLDTPLAMKDVTAYRRQEWWTWMAIRKCLAAEQLARRLRRAPHPHLLPAQFKG
jgi:hypothetical protein